jgi:putative hemolysin
MKIIFKVLVFVLAVILLGALAIFFAPGKNAPVVEAPEQMKDDSGDAAADEIYCNQYDPQDCPWNCVVCPPCEVCSSIQCRAKASCAAMGFDENWYKENVTPVEKPAPDGGGQAPNAGMANPASVYCIDQGGKLEIREGDGGQYGVCVMPDATECVTNGNFSARKNAALTAQIMSARRPMIKFAIGRIATVWKLFAGPIRPKFAPWSIGWATNVCAM